MIHAPAEADGVPNGGVRPATPIVMAVMTTRKTICVGNRYRYGMSPEYQRAIGGSHVGAMVATRICPTTRPKKSTSRIAISAA